MIFLIQHFEADCLWKVSLKILKTFTYASLQKLLIQKCDDDPDGDMIPMRLPHCPSQATQKALSAFYTPQTFFNEV